MIAATAIADEESGLMARTAAAPWDADLMLRLGTLQTTLLKYPEAAETLRRAIVLAPDDPRPWMVYATLSIHLHEGQASTDMAFHRVAKVGGSDPAYLLPVIEFFAKDEQPDIAMHYLQKLLEAHPAAPPKVQLRYVEALRALGRTAEAECACRNLVATLTSAADSMSTATREQILIHRAFLLQAAGLEAEIDASLEDCARRLAPVTPAFDDQTGLLPRSSARVAEFQAATVGKDVFVFLPGPSLQTFVDRSASFAEWDFVAAVTAGYTQTIEDAVLRPIGRHVDLMWMSNPAQLRCAEASIIDVLERTRGISLLAQAYSFSGYARMEAFMERFRDRMLWVNCADQPPLPSAPLQFLSGSSLSALIPILIWGRPGRIFLFGADGGASPTEVTEKAYFFAGDPAGGVGAQRNELTDRLEKGTLTPIYLEDMHRRFKIEAREADAFVRISLKILTVLFGLPLPMIYNCCPHSAHGAFEKISVDRALTMAPR